MGRPLVYVPPEGALFEITSRTLQSRYLLRPSAHLNELVAGVVGRAQRLYEVDLHGLTFPSNHFHLLGTFVEPEQLSGFVGYLKGNLAREAGRLHDWRERFWGRRYRAIQVSDEEAAQVARLRYILEHGCKENLVWSPMDWPGVHCAGALSRGEAIEGLWFDRTAEYRARRRGEEPARTAFATPEQVVLTPLPCWRQLSAEQVRHNVEELIREIEEETRLRHRRKGSTPIGITAVLAQDPHQRPRESKRAPAPRFHAVSREVRRAMWTVYSLVYAAYRRAHEKLMKGVGPVVFPAGCHPPRLPRREVPYALVPL